MDIEIVNEDLLCPLCKTPVKAGEGVHFYFRGKDTTTLQMAIGHFLCPLEMEKLAQAREKVTQMEATFAGSRKGK